MRNACQHLQFIFAAAIVIMLLSMPCPDVLANNDTATTTQNTTATVDNDTSGNKSVAKAKAKSSTTRVKDKSVLDAEVLDSPLAYFKEAFTPEDESEDNIAPALMNTVKALVATLLSTVI
ncbi:hypothetical protein [Pontibacter pudoricolor]|uniref:hypothetical protein n=1 Tax=Pontibacter pudoricolor TaxID=2694930 RepID=UPI0013916A86|nr:hypothetical protein [Pontibacter pudoricolor]